MTKTHTRKLAAIMFTDMVGYTALMQEDEARAKLHRDRHREVLNKIIKLHSGEVLQYFGDGTLSIFDSSVSAVKSALTIQNELSKAPRIPLRVGIHTSDIVRDFDGIYGDGVNIASRIESLATTNSILISDKVYDDLKSHPEFICKNLGRFELKNVDRPIEVFAVVAPYLHVPDANSIKGKTKTTFKSVAVLPFMNMSADPENEYFSDGITDEIINALAKIEGLQVTSRTSSFSFKNKNIDIRDIGKQLGVQTLLEGSVRKSGEKVRITAQLINTHDGYHFWSETYDRKLQDIFAVQDEISITIANRLKDTLSGREIKENLVNSQTKNVEAYNLYLKGQYLRNKDNPTDAQKAIKLFEQAIKVQPDFARPYPALSYCYGYLGIGGQIDHQVAIQKSIEYGDKGMALDNTYYENYLIKALASFFYQGNIDATFENLEIALKLNPNAAEVYHVYSQALLSIGLFNEAKNKLEKAMELDPLSLTYKTSYGIVKTFVRQYEEAERILNEVLEMDPNYRSAIENLGWVYFLKGDIEKSISTFKQFQQMTGSKYKGLTGLAFVYARTGKREEAEKLLDLMKQRQKEEPEVSLNVDYAMVYAGFGEYEKTVEMFRELMKIRQGISVWFAHPMWDDAKENEIFKKFLAEMGERIKSNNVYYNFSEEE